MASCCNLREEQRTFLRNTVWDPFSKRAHRHNLTFLFFNLCVKWIIFEIVVSGDDGAAEELDASIRIYFDVFDIVRYVNVVSVCFFRRVQYQNRKFLTIFILEDVANI